jgi:NADPH:quinone reductase-like Zn-dependent oxidoreductase
MKYKSAIVTRRGSPGALQIIENDLRAPWAGEVRVRVRASSVSADDVGSRRGNRPFPPKLPFVPAYAIIGESIRGLHARNAHVHSAGFLASFALW